MVGLGLLVVGMGAANAAHAYDLSRAYESNADEVERGFVVGSVALWVPEIGSYEYYHQTSLDYGVEFGFRFASIQSAHNLYVVGGFNFSPQYLDAAAARDDAHRASDLILGYGGVRYMTGFLCFGDGLGCPFFELRLGLVFESVDDQAGHDGPWATFTALPGVGYRFSFGRVFQTGARLDIAYTEESGRRDFGWVSFTGFAGLGW